MMHRRHDVEYDFAKLEGASMIVSSLAPVERYDALIVGAGPAGLSAAIGLARACRSVAVFECKRPGRSDWGQLNRNYLGFPDGISIVELGERGTEQAERYGARFFDTRVVSMAQDDHGFVSNAGGTAHHSRGVILATGVTDRWVEFPGYRDYIGKSMHWCIACDGFEMQGKRVVVVGNDAHGAELAIRMLGFDPEDVTVLTNSGALGLRPAMVQELQDRGIRLVVDRLVDATARKKGYFQSVRLEGGEHIELDHLFSAQGAEPNTELARSLGVELNNEGYIKVDTEARTSVPGVYAAGDVTRLFSHQVLTAAHEGATAASALDHAMYLQDKEAFRAGRVAIGGDTT